MVYKFKEIVDVSYPAASKIVPHLLKIFPNTKNVIDLGGGLGQWCKAFKENGIEKVLCIDHPSVNKNDLLINEDEFLAINVENNFPSINQKFDLALSIEFAEHIKGIFNREIVNFLTKSSDVIIFSAAIPNQGGINHINEKRLNYWTNLFNEFGFIYLDIIRPIIIDKTDIPFYYKQNLSVFISDKISNNYSSSIRFNIDPNEFEIVSLRILNRKPGIVESVKLLISAIIRIFFN